MKKNLLLPIFLTAFVGLLAIAGSFFLWIPEAIASTDINAEGFMLDPQVWKWGLIAAAVTTSVSSLGAAYAVAVVGSAAMGALTEKPELFGRLLIFVGLAEGIAIYGVIISVLILDKMA